MIQLSAITTCPGTGNLAETLGSGSVKAGEISVFSELLAGHLNAVSARSDPAVTAISISPLPDNGKILPPALPLLIGTDVDEATAIATEDQSAEPTTQPLFDGPVSLDFTAVTMASPLPVIPAGATDTVPRRPVDQPPLAITPLTLPVGVGVSSPLKEIADRPAFTGSGQPPVQFPPLAAPVLVVIPDKQALPILPIVANTPSLAAAVPPVKGAEGDVPSAKSLRVRAVSPVITFGSETTLISKSFVVLPPIFEPLHNKPSLLRDGSLLQDTIVPAMAGALPAEPISTTSSVAAIRPLDFAALVDRLTQAREAAGPQSVSFAVNHDEFGKVSLRFHHDDAGLSVAMTSPDPDFARAVSATIPPERAVTGEQQQAVSQGQSSRNEAGNSETPGQPRNGANPEHRDGRGLPRPNPSQSRHRHEDHQSGHDIFA